ncbi:MAG: hypothetical protein PHV32_13325, partial [Eubacteriales bacterium]|nr:hypothetical protein [Eubacteriales bacterium]
GFLLSFRDKRQQSAPKLSYKQRFRQSIGSNKASYGFSELLGNAVLDSVNTGLLIGGYIILFSVIIGMLNDTGALTPISSFIFSLTGNEADGSLAAGIVSGIIEITSGTYLISAVQSISLPFKLAATSFVIGWAGLSVHSQVKSVISKSDLSMKIYLWGKQLQGLIAAVYSYIFVSLASPAVTCTAYQSAFEFLRKNFEDSLATFMESTEWLAYAFMFLLSAGLLLTKKRIPHH